MRKQARIIWIGLVLCAMLMPAEVKASTGYWATGSGSINMTSNGNITASGSASSVIGFEITGVTAVNQGIGAMNASFSGSTVFANWTGGTGTTSSTTTWLAETSNTFCSTENSSCTWTKSIPANARSVLHSISSGSSSYNGSGTITYYGTGAPNSNQTWNSKSCSVSATSASNSTSCGFGVVADRTRNLVWSISPAGTGNGNATCGLSALSVSVTANANRTSTLTASCEYQKNWYYYSGSASWETPVTSNTTIWNYSGTIQYTYRYWVANAPPLVSISHNAPNPLYRGTTVTFVPTVSDPDGSITSAGWSGILTGTGTKTYFTASLGTFTATYSATDNRGATSSASTTLVVTNRIPIVTFTQPSSTNTNAPTILSNTQPTFQWQMNDADGDAQVRFHLEIMRMDGSRYYRTGEIISASTQWTPTFSIPTGINFYVTVRSFDGHDWSQTSAPTYFRIEPNQAPIAEFQWTPTLLFEGDAMQLQNLSMDPDSDGLTYSWEITNPSGLRLDISGTNPLIIGLSKGIYSIRLKATDAYGALSEKIRTVVVQDLVLSGTIRHTSEWEQMRLQWNERYPSEWREPTHFWAGEALMLRVSVTNTLHSLTKPNYVKARLLTTQDEEILTQQHSEVFTGMMVRANHRSLLSDGPHTMRFTIGWSNGYTEIQDVLFYIKDHIFDVLINHQRL